MGLNGGSHDRCGQGNDGQQIMRMHLSPSAHAVGTISGRARWNSILAGVVFQHPPIESLRRELNRNGPLREMGGLGGSAPSVGAYTRFLHRILKHQAELDEMIHQIIEDLQQVLPTVENAIMLTATTIPGIGRWAYRSDPVVERVPVKRFSSNVKREVTCVVERRRLKPPRRGGLSPFRAMAGRVG